MTADIIVAGHICLDIIPTLSAGVTQILPGQLLEAGAAVIAPGGAVANTGIALHRLGAQVKLMGKVGDDLFGRAIAQALESHGPELSEGLIVAPGDTSSYSVILSPPGTDRMFIHAPGCNDTFGASDIHDNLLSDARLFHFGYPPLMARMYATGGQELASLLQRIKAQAITTALDMAMPDPHGAAALADWHAILAAVLPSVDIFLPSIEDLLLLLRPSTFNAPGSSDRLLDAVSPALFAELASDMICLGAAIVGLKAGHRGLYLRTADLTRFARMGHAAPADLSVWSNRELWAPCFATQVLGTTGAGDTTIAGFLFGLLHGLNPAATLVHACAVGACSVEGADAVSGVLDWDTTAVRIANGWEPALLTLDGEGWRWNADAGVWIGPQDGKANE